jgi:hypothetical protein
MASISINDFEKKIADFFNEISTVSLEEYHQLMEEYADVWRAIRDDMPYMTEKGNRFLEKISKMPFSYYTAKDLLGNSGNQIISFIKHPELKDNLPLNVFLSKDKEKGFVCSNLFCPIYEKCLVQSVIAKNKHPYYPFEFNPTQSILASGLPFTDELVEDRYLHDDGPNWFKITFPQKSPFEKALVSKKKIQGKYLLEGVLVKLDSEIFPITF